jgi:hypothetical protein
MVMPVLRSRLAIALSLSLSLSCLALPACSSDAAPLPEPDIETPGAFIAFDEGITGKLSLIRTLDTLELPHETILFASVYDVDPVSWDEARELSKRHDLPLRLDIQFVTETPLKAVPYRVVWFRTLSEEEKERVP